MKPGDALAQLSELLEEVGAVVTFDPHRNITLCASCGRLAPLGTAWKTIAPGTNPGDCRRLCLSCAKRADNQKG